ncbi:hypothetical protein CCR94_09500 [Rhodoblastus sphagnicola]|uniref:UPF0178 protein CCR94_09500 n=1 Tax=Rhodoblastus sphagnicola TaxID=333368 RepID=A0A2S6N9V0_9HYPH|nr:YaiI/YqxD family protein [Rhodoblastus sphagnicola]MBB4198196.1 hypothetical protein [Rhodoblastus sphagnicola]PPQ31367.1 hypothetical protein CCR94_09500 [Rhodoblastus sphagnicola]
MDPEIFVDADACPVKDECYKVAARHGLKVYLVANRLFQAPRHPMIERVLVPQGPDVADDWIAERADATKIVVTADIPLAARCVKTGAFVLAPNGKIFDESSIGMALAMRNLMDELRSGGEITGGPKGFTPRDRSAFLSALERCVQHARRSQKPAGQA